MSGECVDAAETCATQAIAQRGPIRLFLCDVSRIDESGRALLARLGSLACGRSLLFVTSLQKSVDPLRRQPMLRASLTYAGRASTDLLSVSPANAAGAGTADVQKNFGTCLGRRCHAGCWASRINHFRWRRTCTIQARRENRQMWVVWSLSGFVGFCFVLSFFETAPAEARSRSRRKS